MTLLPIVTTALRTHGRARAGQHIARSTTFLLISALPLIAIVAAVPGQLLDLVFPSSYSVAGTALVWAFIAQTVLALVASFTSATTADGKPYVSMGSWLVCIPVQLAVGAFLIPHYGMVGTAIASLVSALAGLLVAAVFILRDFGLPVNPGPAFKAAGAALVVYLLLRVPAVYPAWVLPLVCLAALAIYAGLLMVSGAVRRSEIAALFQRRRNTTVNESP